MMNAAGQTPRVIVAGTGFGCRIQVPALRVAGFEVAGLVGTDHERTRERAATNDIAAAFTDLDEAIARTGATAVAIATPPPTHRDLCLQAISAGCHVLCEKPFAMDRAEARTMLAAARSAGVVHALGNEFRWEAVRTMAARMTARGNIGRPRLATFTQYLHYAGHPQVELPDWWFDPRSGGGWLGASGSHLVDWIRSWLGEFESVSAAMSSVTGPSEGAEDSFTMRFRLKGGLEGSVQQTAGAFGNFASMTRVAGSEGTIWIDKGEVWLGDRNGSRVIGIDPDLSLKQTFPDSSDPRQHRPEWQMLSAVEFAPYVKLCESWLASIECRSIPGCVAMPTFDDGVANMAVLDAIRASAASGGILTRVEGPEE